MVVFWKSSGVAKRRFQRVLVDEGAPPGRVAAHLLRAPPAGAPCVTERLRGAARSAMAAGAPQVAAELLRRALAEPPKSGGAQAVKRQAPR